MTDVILTHIREIISLDRSELGGSLPIRLRCVVVERTKTKSSIFLTLQDDTGAFQAVVDHTLVDPGTWTAAVALKTGDSAVLAGITTAQFETARATLNQIAEVSDAEPHRQFGRQRVGLGSPTTQVYVARLQNHVRMLFESAGFTEIVPRVLSSAKPPSPGVYPLKVLYDGFGAPFYMAPSPAPQIVRALAATSYQRVFAVSRCFTHTYRDPIVSVESVIVCGGARKTTLESLLLWLDLSVRDLFGRPDVKNTKVLTWGSTNVVNYGAARADGSRAVEHPEVQEFEATDPWGRSSVVGRLCWPQTSEASFEFREHVLAEGYLVGPREDPAFSVVTLNVDRLLTLVLEQADLRRIPALRGEPSGDE